MTRRSGRGGGQAPSESIGIYVHIPWCRAICTYCDFDRQAHAFQLLPAYVDALVSEAHRQPRLTAHSLFFGGGTPSLLEPDQLQTILEGLRGHFRLRPSAEVTVEVNPGDLDAERAAAYLSHGVNRLSLGVQTFDDELLRLLGRRHDAAEAVGAVREARRGGVVNLSFDLMYGLPGQTPAHWRRTLEQAVALEPEHLSAYLLTIDERVPLGRQVQSGRISLPPDDDVAEMYDDARAMLAAGGLEQYEISNWARPGFQSRHNLTYWRDEPYVGLGAGAASSVGGRRYKHAPDPAAYIAAQAEGRAVLVEDEQVDPLTALQDHLALGLRLREGLPLARVRDRFGLELVAALGTTADDLLRAGVLELVDGALRIGERHLLVSNEVILRLHAALTDGHGPLDGRGARPSARGSAAPTP